MIDFENYIYTQIVSALTTAFGAGAVASGSEYTDVPPKFPFVSVEQTDNYVRRNRRTVKIENTNTVAYEINVYSNKVDGRKSEAKAIMAVVDATMEQMGFTRTMLNPIPNLANATIYRLVARYIADTEVEQSGNDLIYTVYQN